MSSNNDKEISEVERQTLAFFNWVESFIESNSRLFLVIGAGFLAANVAGLITFGIPSWWPIVLVVVGAGVGLGWLAKSRVYELIPEPEKIKAVDQSGRGVYAVHPDEWEQFEHIGEMFQWDESPHRTYELASFDRDERRAVGNWKESIPHSDFAKERTPGEVLTKLRDFREKLEPEVAEAREIKRRARSIQLQIEREREREKMELFDSMEMDNELDDVTSVGEIFDREMPENIHPHAGGSDDEGGEPETASEQTNGHTEGNVEVESDQFDAILEEPPTRHG